MSHESDTHRRVGTTGRGDYRRLSWDSDHFGFPVGRIEWNSELPSRLSANLRSATDDGIKLLYLSIPDPAPLSDDELTRLGGSVMGRRVTFGADPQWLLQQAGVDAGRLTGVTEAAIDDDVSALRELAIAAGEYSRFRLDPRIQRDRFTSLYRTWLDRSLTGELATSVLVARGEDGHPVGLVTLSAYDRRAAIGLIAVRAGARGRGWGRALIAAAASWTAARGLATLTVETQRENTAACRLYSRCGLIPRQTAIDVHFWLDDHGGRT